MPEHLSPGTFVAEGPAGPPAVEGVDTTTAGFVGQTEHGPKAVQALASWEEYECLYGGFLDPRTGGYLPYAVRGFFQNGGTRAFVARVTVEEGAPYAPEAYVGADDPACPGTSTGLKGLAAVPEVAILCVPDQPLIDAAHQGAMTRALVEQCESLRSRVCLLQSRADEPDAGGLHPPASSSYAAFYYPWITVLDPAGEPLEVPPGGHIAGLIARSDRERGVWKAPAGAAAGPLGGGVGLAGTVTEPLQAVLADRGVNCLRDFGRGVEVWGARTCAADGSEYKYVPVRRLAVFIGQSLDRSLKWVAFEPNAESTWARVRDTIGRFLHDLWGKGALLGDRPGEAFFVACDGSTMMPDDIAGGRLICEIGIAPVRPAEFVVLRIGAWTREASVP